MQQGRARVLRKPHKSRMEAFSDDDLPSLRLAEAFCDAIPEGASDSLCMDALALTFVAFAQSAIEGGSPKAALVLWARMLLDDVERL